MKLNQLLLELGNAPYPWNWLMGSAPDPDSPYNCQKSGEARFEDEQDNEYYVKLYYGGEPESVKIFWDKNGLFHGSDAEHSPIRTIFTIMDIIRKYVNMIQPKYISFTAGKSWDTREDRNKLGSLYTTMINRFADKAGYDAQITQSTNGWKINFILTRRH